MYLYGGSTCPPPPISCDFWGYQSFGPLLDDTVVLDFSSPEGPTWRVYSAVDMLARQHAPEEMPPALGVALSAYDPDSVSLVVWSCLDNITEYRSPVIRADLPVWSLDMVRGSRVPLNGVHARCRLRCSRDQ